MMLADILPQSNLIQTTNTMVKTVIIDEIMTLPTTSSESMYINDNSSSISSIKIPLVSFEPILATSPNYILVNEFTRKRNQFVLFDDHLEKFIMRSTIDQPVLDTLWDDNHQYFLLLTATNIFIFDPIIKNIQLLNEFIPRENKYFKCFTLINQSTLLIAYNEWDVEYIDKWQYNNENGLWKCVEKQSLILSPNEFIGTMTATIDNECSNLAITIYNDLTEQWRVEFRNTETFIRDKEISLPGSNIMHDYRIISVKNAESDIKWLVFSSANSNIIAVDSKWRKIKSNYKYPVQRMALFKENYLIIRTTERVDVHSFL